jgi:hypothetical protein
VPLDRTVHPPFEQDERSDDGIQIARRQIAVPDPGDRLGCKEVDDRHDDAEHQGSGDQGLDPQQLGRHHFLHQRVLEVCGHPRVLVVFLVAPERRHCSPLSFRGASKRRTRNLEIPDSMLRIAPE